MHTQMHLFLNLYCVIKNTNVKISKRHGVVIPLCVYECVCACLYVSISHNNLEVKSAVVRSQEAG